MTSKWFSWSKAQKDPHETGFKRSLVRNILIALLSLSFFPLALTAIVTYFRSNNLLSQQITAQAESITQNEANLLEQYVSLRAEIVDHLVADEQFKEHLFSLVNNSLKSAQSPNTKTDLVFIFQTNARIATHNYLEEMLILSADGELLLSTNNEWVESAFGKSQTLDPRIEELIGSNRSIFVFIPSGTANELTLLTSRSFINEQGHPVATLVAVAPVDSALQILAESPAPLPGTMRFFFDSDSQLFNLTDQGQLIRVNQPEISMALSPLVGQTPAQIPLSANFQDGTPVLAFARWLPNTNIGMVLAVPKHTVLAQNALFDPLNILLIAFTFILSGGIIYLVSTRLVNPIAHLSEVAAGFLQGHRSERSQVKHNDEIGLLSHAFNQMAGELSGLSQPQEAAGTRQANQIDIASEIAQQAISTTRLDEVSSKAVKLIADRFGFSYASIFLFDETGQYLTPQAACGSAVEPIGLSSSRIEPNEETLMGWTAINNQTRIHEGSRGNSTASQDGKLPDAQAEAAIPISQGSDVLGVLYIQSTLVDPFDQETISALETLSGQIANILQKTFLLESAINDAQEITLVRQVTQMIARARSESEILQNLADIFSQLPHLSSFLSIEKDEVKTLSVTDSATNQAEKNLPYAALSEIINAGLKNLRVLNALQKRLGELQILASFSQSISAETDLNNLYRELHVQVIQTFGPDLEFGVALYNRKKNLIEFPYYFEKGGPITVPAFPLGDGLTSMLLQSRQPILLPDKQSIQMHSGIQIGEPAKSWMGIPLIFAGEIIGAVIVQDLENENRFIPDDLNMLATLAPQIAITVRNTQLYTETQQALHAYDQEHYLLNTLLDNMPEGITFKDCEGCYIRASSSVAQPLNVSPEELIGKTDRHFMDEEAASLIYQDEQRVLNSGSAEIGVIQPVTVNDVIKAWIHTSRIPIYLPTGEPYGLLIIQRDITGLKQAEELAQQRADQVTIAAEIARDATGTLEVKTLLQKAVNLINERFGFYQASIFLVDPDNEYAVLRESTGPAGQQMLQAGHRLAVGSKSIVGQVSASGKALIVNDVTQSPTHFPNPLLPDTHSELAIPLIVGERVLGALDVQSTQINAFNDEDVGVLQILADQLAVAVVNGELFAKTQELLGKHRLLRQISIAANSSTNLEETLTNVTLGLLTARVGERIAILMLNYEGNLQVQASAGYEGTRHLELRIALGQGITGQAALERRPIRVDNTLADPRYINADRDVRSELAIPILFNEQLLGVLNLESMQPAGFDENDLEILGALGNNLGAVITNIRLIEQIRRQVVRERQLFDVTSKIRHSVDLETILETSTREICRVLGARRAKIQITAGTEPVEPEEHTGRTGSENDRGPGNGRAAGRSD